MSADEDAGASGSARTAREGHNRTEKKRKLVSEQSLIHSFIRFVNTTERRVNVVWLNYQGEGIHYSSLSPEQYVDVNTFEGHPWIFRDADTGDRLVVQRSKVYRPIGFNLKADGWPPKRKIVNISLPVYSLTDRCMQVVRDRVPAHQVDQLELPELLKQGIQELVVLKDKAVNASRR